MLFRNNRLFAYMYIVCCETVRTVSFPSDSLASYCYADHAILLSKLTNLPNLLNILSSFREEQNNPINNKVDGCLSIKPDLY